MRLQLVVAGMLAVSFAGCRQAGAKTVKGPDQSVPTDASIHTVEVVLEEGATITLASSKDTVEVVELSYKGYSSNPISLQKTGSTVKVHLEEGRLLTNANASFTLRLPPGKDVKIRGIALTLDGTLAAKKVDIEAKALHSELSIDADSTRYKGGAVRLPAGTVAGGSTSVEGSAVSLKLAVARCKRLDVKGKAVSGTVKAPAATEVNVPGTVDIVRVP